MFYIIHELSDKKKKKNTLDMVKIKFFWYSFKILHIEFN